MRPTLLLFLLLLLAGCTSAPDAVQEAPEPTDALEASPQPDVAPPGPTFVTVPVSLDGNLGHFVSFCEYENTQVCRDEELTPCETDYFLEQPGAVLVAADLNLTWTSTSPATDTLGLGLMRMGNDSAMVDDLQGTSPLRLEATGLDLPLDDANRVHAYVYNARGLAHRPPAYAYATIDEPFRLEGTLTFRVPAPATPPASATPAP